MGLFSKKPQPQPEPVRPEQVRRLKELGKAVNDAILFDVPGCPYYPRARALLDAAIRNSTQAEIHAAWPGLATNGGRSRKRH
jgi:hypothetical protein